MKPGLSKVSAKADPEPASSGTTWLDAQDVWQRYHVHPRTLRRWRSEKLIAFSKIKNKIWYEEEEINRVLAGRKVQAVVKEVADDWPLHPVAPVLLFFAVFIFPFISYI